MKKLMMAVLAASMSIAVGSAYAGEMKGDMKKSDTGTAKSEKGTAKKGEAVTKEEKDDAKKKDKKGEMKK